MDCRRDVGVLFAAMDVQTVDTILVGTLISKFSARLVFERRIASREGVRGSFRSNLTLRGRRRPTIHKSKPLQAFGVSCLLFVAQEFGLPAPSPFSPFSSSSSKRKFRGTLAPIMAVTEVFCRCSTLTVSLGDS